MSENVGENPDGINENQGTHIKFVLENRLWGFKCLAPGCGEVDIGYARKPSAMKGAKQHLARLHPRD